MSWNDGIVRPVTLDGLGQRYRRYRLADPEAEEAMDAEELAVQIEHHRVGRHSASISKAARKCAEDTRQCAEFPRIERAF